VAENTKYDVLLSELGSTESQVLVLINKWKSTTIRNRELEDQASMLKKENFELLQKISRIEEELEKCQKAKVENPLNIPDLDAGGSGLFNTLNPKEREQLKIKLQNLISRIDYHLSSERQV